MSQPVMYHFNVANQATIRAIIDNSKTSTTFADFGTIFQGGFRFNFEQMTSFVRDFIESNFLSLQDPNVQLLSDAYLKRDPKVAPLRQTKFEGKFGTAWNIERGILGLPETLYGTIVKAVRAGNWLNGITLDAFKTGLNTGGALNQIQIEFISRCVKIYHIYFFSMYKRSLVNGPRSPQANVKLSDLYAQFSDYRNGSKVMPVKLAKFIRFRQTFFSPSDAFPTVLCQWMNIVSASGNLFAKNCHFFWSTPIDATIIKDTDTVLKLFESRELLGSSFPISF
jgi:hypothetical protein